VASNGDVLSKELRVPDRPQTLVQTVVRPAGSERFKLEDALKASGKVCPCASALRAIDVDTLIAGSMHTS
jgi:hypothetical protein